MNELTPREFELARLVATGLSNQQVAARLQISRQTVKNHMQAIYKKLGIGNRVQLTLWLSRAKPQDDQTPFPIQ